MGFTPNPVAFTVFGIDIRWYAIIICTGMILASLIIYRRAPKYGIDSENILDVLLCSIPAGIVGARVWYVVCNLHYYDSFLEMINIRSGGLAIHGGLIFGLTTAAIVCKVKKINIPDVLDLAVPCIALGQAIGRWGNYFNSEAYGSPTDLPWAITIDGVKVHPTFLYESLWCLMLFFLLSWILGRRKFKGQIVCLYAALYSLERFFVEQLRTDSLLTGPSHLKEALQAVGYDPTLVDGVLHIGDFLIFPCKTAQLISVLGIVIGLGVYFVLKKRKVK